MTRAVGERESFVMLRTITGQELLPPERHELVVGQASPALLRRRV